MIPDTHFSAEAACILRETYGAGPRANGVFFALEAAKFFQAAECHLLRRGTFVDLGQKVKTIKVLVSGRAQAVTVSWGERESVLAIEPAPPENPYAVTRTLAAVKLDAASNQHDGYHLGAAIRAALVPAQGKLPTILPYSAAQAKVSSVKASRHPYRPPVFFSRLEVNCPRSAVGKMRGARRARDKTSWYAGKRQAAQRGLNGGETVNVRLPDQPKLPPAMPGYARSSGAAGIPAMPQGAVQPTAQDISTCLMETLRSYPDLYEAPRQGVCQDKASSGACRVSDGGRLENSRGKGDLVQRRRWQTRKRRHSKLKS